MRLQFSCVLLGYLAIVGVMVHVHPFFFTMNCVFAALMLNSGVFGIGIPNIVGEGSENSSGRVLISAGTGLRPAVQRYGASTTGYVVVTMNSSVPASPAFTDLRS